MNPGLSDNVIDNENVLLKDKLSDIGTFDEVYYKDDPK